MVGRLLYHDRAFNSVIDLIILKLKNKNKSHYTKIDFYAKILVLARARW